MCGTLFIQNEDALREILSSGAVPLETAEQRVLSVDREIRRSYAAEFPQCTLAQRLVTALIEQRTSTVENKIGQILAQRPDLVGDRKERATKVMQEALVNYATVSGLPHELAPITRALNLESTDALAAMQIIARHLAGSAVHAVQREHIAALSSKFSDDATTLLG